MPLNRKLVTGFALMLLVALGVGGYSLYNLQVVSRQIDRLYRVDLQAVLYAKDAETRVAKMGRAVRQAVLAMDEMQRRTALKELGDAQVELDRSIGEVRARAVREEARLQLAKFDDNYAVYKQQVNEAVNLLKEGAMADLRNFIGEAEFQRRAVAATDSLAAITRLKEDSAAQAANEAAELTQHSAQLTIFLLSGGIALSVLLGWLISRSIIGPEQRLRAHVDQLAHGNLEGEVPHIDHPNEVGELARSLAVLQHEAQQMDSQRWIKQHLAQLSTHIQAATSLVDLSRRFFSDMAPVLKLGQGLLYRMDEDAGRLFLVSGYAVHEPSTIQQSFALGEGLTGQCAIEAAPILLQRPPAEYMRIGSGLGGAAPQTIIVQPILHNERVLGVLELACFDAFDPVQQALFEGAMPLLAMTLEIIDRSEKTQQLLAETRRQADNMERQAAQLEEQTVELEAQQKEIRATEAWYRGIIEAAPDGMLVANDQGQIVMVNPQLETMFGYDPGELIGRAIEALVPDAVRARHPALRTGFLQDAGSRQMGAGGQELRGQRKNGTVFPVEVGLSKLPALGGRGVCVCASVRDVTERHEAQQVLAEQQAALANILDNSPVGTAFSTDGVFRYANPAFRDMFGLSEGGMASDIYLSPSDREVVLVQMEEHGRVRNHEMQLRTKDGSTGDFLVTFLPMVRGGQRGVMGFLVDITERKQAEAEAEHNRQFMETVLENFESAVYVKDREGRYTYVNRDWERATGFQRFQVIGRTAQDINHLGRGTEFHAGDLATMEAGQVVVEEQETETAAGQRYYQITKVPMHENGAVTGLCSVAFDVTERRTGELRLRTALDQVEQSKKLNQAILDNSPAVIYLKAPDGRYLFVNQAWCNIFGLRPQDVVGKTAAELFPHEQASAYTSTDLQVLQAGEVQHSEETADVAGVLHTYASIKIPMRDAEGHIYAVCAIATDMTERLASEKAVAESEQRLNMALRGANLGMWDWRVETGRSEIDDIWAEMLGYTRDELAQSDTQDVDAWLRLIHPDDAAAASRCFEQCIGGELLEYRVEFRMRAKSGDWRWILSIGRATRRDEQGKALRIVGIHQDITEQRLASERVRAALAEVQKSQSLNRALLDNSPTDIYLKDTAGRFLLVNAHFASHLRERLHVETEALMGHSLSELVGEDIDQWGQAADAQVLASGRLMEFEQVVGSPERPEYRQVFKFPVRDASGEVYAIGAIAQDVTERKRMQDEMRRAKEAAEDATKAKSDFLANMSHEIRTPMNAIIGMSHLALETQLDKRQRNYIEKVNRSAENLLGIINDILDFSKIEAGKMSMERVDFRLEDVIDNLANLVGMKAEDRGLELLFEIAPDVPTALVGDPLRLGQVLINLGNNAVKFTEHGEIVVGVSCVSASDGQAELHFWVRDTGIGMTAEQCGRMFQSFSQADSSTTRKYGGTGLGLAISKNLVELMNGRIWVESQPGVGSSFHFHVVLGVQAVPTPRRSYDATAFEQVRTLVVDDNASAREILTRMVQGFQMPCDTAANGQEALAQLQAAQREGQPFELVLLDWKMPVLDGLETLDRLPAAGLSPMPAVIMVTSHAREEAMQNAGANGVRPKAILTKPVTASTLLEAMGEALGKGVVLESRSHQKADARREHMDALRGSRVLLVEDNDMNQELAMELLGQAGIDVVLANNGQEALDVLARDTRFDGILMDCQMPVMDGYTASRHIRADAALAHIPIVAMTANAMAGDREKVMEAGMLDHIAKPLNVENMFATMARWMVSVKSAKAPASVPLAPSVTAVTGLSPITGLDTQRGLTTTMDNPALYRRLLLKFRDGQRDFGALFAAARRGSDATAPARVAHTLKGTAGNIGAVDVEAAAGRLERLCLDGGSGSDIEVACQHVLSVLDPLMTGLDALDSAAPAATTPSATGGQVTDWTSRLRKLRHLLEACDSDATLLLEELEQEAKGGPLAQALKPVTRAVADFDFDRALEVLAPLESEGHTDGG
ncbi:MAG: PAS domain S-box protein [Hydrogenophaga sp.]|nr:PAS domain S-box protein [Hydrogenophaga sp.]